jgi:hypothetical protein
MDWTKMKVLQDNQSGIRKLQYLSGYPMLDEYFYSLPMNHFKSPEELVFQMVLKLQFSI